MREIVVTIENDHMRIDGELPPGYRLVVHNHTGDADFYPYMLRLGRCLNGSDDDDAGDGLCHLYVDDPSVDDPPS